MIENYNFPEGTKAQMKYCEGLDFFTEDFPFNWEQRYKFQYQTSRTAIKDFNMDAVWGIGDWFTEVRGLKYIPPIDVTSKSTYYNFNFPTVCDLDIVFKGQPRDCTMAWGDNFLKNFPRAWFPCEYDYSGYKANADKDTLFIPYGDVTIRKRILCNGAWLTGEPVEFNHQPMTYTGKGIYEITQHIEPRRRYIFPIHYQDKGTPTPVSNDVTDVILDEIEAYKTTIVGDDILALSTANDGWFYDAELGGVRNKVITSSKSTSLTIQLPSSTCTDDVQIVIEQSSEMNYDYCRIYDENNNVLWNGKGQTGEKTLSFTNKTLRFYYSKDSSGDQGKDAFWIKSITYTPSPPYPEE